jgi:hypothetical protein
MLSDRDSERGRSKVAIMTRGIFSEVLRPLVRQAGLELQPVVSPRELSGEPVGVIVPLDSSPEVWAELQEDPAYGAIPLLGLAQGANELSFAETFARGGEDLLALGAPEDALAKLRAIPVPAQRPEPSGHRVLVVSEDAGWRAGVARRLRGAGIEAIFAATEAELRASAGGVALAVIDGRRQPERAVAMARVWLAATVVWARGFGPRSRAISPPGMGLRIDGGLPGEWELFQQGCRALLG